MQQRPTAVLLNDTRVDAHHGCSRVCSAIETLLEKQGIDLAATHPAHSDWSGNQELVAVMEKAQVIIVNGEGTIHHDSVAGKRLLMAGTFAKSRGIPAVLINCGWEENSPEFIAMLDEFALVSFRDNRSAAALHGRPCRVVPDLSLYPDKRLSSTHQRKHIGFTDSVDRFKSHRLEHSRKLAKGQTVSVVFPRKGASGYLHFLRKGVSLKKDIFTPMSFAQTLAVRHKLWQASTPDVELFLAQLTSLKLVVSGRFHVCTLAIMTETPFIAIPSNTAKIGNLIEDAELEAWRADGGLEPNELNHAAKRGWSAAELQSLRDYRAMAQVKAEALFQDIRALA